MPVYKRLLKKVLLRPICCEDVKKIKEQLEFAVSESSVNSKKETQGLTSGP